MGCINGKASVTCIYLMFDEGFCLFQVLLISLLDADMVRMDHEHVMIDIMRGRDYLVVKIPRGHSSVSAVEVGF